MKNLLQVALQCSLAASQAIMDYYNAGNFNITIKPDKSPVTPADMASHNIFSNLLAQHFPTIPLVSEEDFHPNSFPPASKYFLLDPLDGTKEFIKKSGEFSISLGLIENNMPVFGAIFHPATNMGYFGGTCMNHETIVDAAGQVDQAIYFYDGTNFQLRTKPKNLPFAAAVLSMNDMRPERFEKMIGKKIEKTCYRGSALKFFSLFDGSANYYPRTAPCCEWDIAGGHALINQLGGKLIAIDENNQAHPMSYGKANARSGHFLCSL